MAWLDWVSLLSIVASPVAWFVGRVYGKRIEAALLRLSDAVGRNPIHRVRLPEDQGLWGHSYAVYERLMPRSLLDPRGLILDWLREDVLQEDTQEIWLVYRRLRQDVHGVLYASWDEETNRCFVSGLVADASGGPGEQILVIQRLWERLQHEVREKVARATTEERSMARTTTEYLIATVCRGEVVGAKEESLAALHDFLESPNLAARLFNAIFADPGTPRSPAESLAFNVLIALVGGDGESEWSQEDVLHAVYDEFLVWRFEYPDDIPGVVEFTAWGKHVGGIKEALSASLPPRILLLPIAAGEARDPLERCVGAGAEGTGLA